MNQLISINYNTELSKLHEILTEYGVCIVNNVLNETECDNITMGMFNTLSHVTSKLDKPFNYQDVTTWNTINELQPTRNLIFQNWGLGQSQFCWDVRTNDKVIDVFERIYNTKDLLVSIDGFSLSLPPEVTGDWEQNSWYHFDQNTSKPNFECVQGWINGRDTNDGDSTLSVMLGSHRLHQQYGNINKPETKKDWIQVNDLDFFTNNGCIEHKIIAPKGSLVLWDSRVLHYGAKPVVGREIINYRNVVYVCYTPRSLSTNKTLLRKIKNFESRGERGFKRVTNHWPHRPVMFSEIPNIKSGIIPDILHMDDPIIEDKYKYLIGY